MGMSGQGNDKSDERASEQGAGCVGMTTMLLAVFRQLPADRQFLVIEDPEEAFGVAAG